MAFPLVCSCENAYKKEEFMSLIINLSRNGLLLLVLLSSVSYADFEINHCYDCGNVLVGAAFFQPNVIKWESNGYSAAILLEAGGSFGFSGDSTYLSERYPNKWFHRSTYDLAIDAGHFSTPPMGHYFAPDKEGYLESPNRYIALLDSPNDVVREVTVWGTGIADDKDNPAITLEVKAVQETLEQTVCFDETAQCQEMLDENDRIEKIRIEEAKLVECAYETAQCKEVEALENRRLVFTIIPRLDPAKVPAGVQPVNHVFIDLIFDDENTQCRSMRQQSFETKNITLNNFNDINHYYHYMGIAGPRFTNAACGFSVPFLVSVNEPFQIQTKNLRLTEKDGYAKITFAVRGHYDREHPEYWLAPPPQNESQPRLGSQPTFRLRTQGKLTVNVKGEGKITSEPAGIDGCTSTTCTAQFPSGEVQLIPDPNTDVSWGENCLEGKVTVVTGQYDTSCTVTFGSLDGVLKFFPAQNSSIESTAQFYGKILEDDRRIATNGGVLTGGAEVEIVATVEPEPEHVNQWAYLLLLVDNTLWIKADQDPVFPWTLWGVLDDNFDFSKNIPADAVTRQLYKQFNIDIFNGIFTPELTGEYNVFVGYLIYRTEINPIDNTPEFKTDQIVFSPEPISFTV
jgi:hypothetical protein